MTVASACGRSIIDSGATFSPAMRRAKASEKRTRSSGSMNSARRTTRSSGSAFFISSRKVALDSTISPARSRRRTAIGACSMKLLMSSPVGLSLEKAVRRLMRRLPVAAGRCR
ncbi:MAG: hypothetical protein WDN72_03930 [Alphaproteobacteria bacterium]